MRPNLRAEPLSKRLEDTILSVWRALSSGRDVDPNKLEIEARLGMIGVSTGGGVGDDMRKIWERSAVGITGVQQQQQSFSHQQAAASQSQFGDDRTCICLKSLSELGSGVSFSSGVDESFLHRHIKSVLVPEYGFYAEAEPATQVFSSDMLKKCRWERDEESGMVKIEKKMPLNVGDSSKLNLALPGGEYDLRLAFSIEESTPAPASFDISSWNTARTKNRTHFRSPEFPHWRVDVTEIELLVRTGSGISLASSATLSSREYEVEFEMERDSVITLSEQMDEREARKFAQEVGASLYGLVTLCIPHDFDATSASESRVTQQYRGYIITANKQLFAMDPRPDKSPLFPGSMPFNMTRKALPLLRENDYYITEKSDGTRYLLYSLAVPDPTKSGQTIVEAVFMNRRGEIFKIGDSIGSARLGFSLGPDTVLDGEVVFHRELKRHVFLIFDVLAVTGQTVVKEIFSKRLETMMKIKANLKRYNDAALTVFPNDLLVITKNFFKKENLKDLLANIRSESGEKIYDDQATAEEGNWKFHKTDGIILQPDKEYAYFSDENMLKWKWPEFRSVDLEVDPPTDSSAAMSLFTRTIETPRIDNIDCTKRGSGAKKDGGVGLPNFDAARLRGEMRAAGVKKRAVAECVFDTSFGQWRFCRLRKDKEQSNPVNVVLNVLMEQAEGVSIEELELVLLGHSAADLQEYMDQARQKYLMAARNRARGICEDFDTSMDMN